MSSPMSNNYSYETKIELQEMPNGTWQVRETEIYTYDNPYEARNRVEQYMRRKETEEYGEIK